MRAMLIVGMAWVASGALADELTYQPLSPSFGGSPLNGSFLLQTAEIQNQFIDDGQFDDLFAEPTLADEFTDALRSTLVSISTGELLDAVVSREDPTGTIELDGATVSYETIGDRVIITVSDGVTTNTLDIPLPVVN
jgi:curli production assembly/transport component CsgF